MFKTVVYIDGLAKSKRSFYSRELHRLGIATRKVQGVTRDENNALTRLADAVAGFVRDTIECHAAEFQALFATGKQAGVLLAV
jgi:hypothetical protein